MILEQTASSRQPRRDELVVRTSLLARLYPVYTIISQRRLGVLICTASL